MVVKTRSGRIIHGVVPVPQRRKRLPTATGHDRNSSALRRTRRAENDNSSTLCTNVATIESTLREQDSALATHPVQLTEERPSNPSVQRSKNVGWQAKQPTIAFVQSGQLATDTDTEIISLNLIDHLLRPENWNRRLSCNTLAASCFYFASQFTEKRNTPEQVALAFIVDPALVYSMTVSTCGFVNQYGMQQMADALSVTPERVREGYAVLWEKRADFQELVGTYQGKMEAMAAPDNTSEDVDSNIGPTHQAIDAAGHASSCQDIVDHSEDDDLLLFDEKDTAPNIATSAGKPSEIDLDLDYDIYDTDPW